MNLAGQHYEETGKQKYLYFDLLHGGSLDILRTEWSQERLSVSLLFHWCSLCYVLQMFTKQRFCQRCLAIWRARLSLSFYQLSSRTQSSSSPLSQELERCSALHCSPDLCFQAMTYAILATKQDASGSCKKVIICKKIKQQCLGTLESFGGAMQISSAKQALHILRRNQALRKPCRSLHLSHSDVNWSMAWLIALHLKEARWSWAQS